LHFTDAFDADFALFLREIKSISLNDMMNDAIEVEVNLMAPGNIKHEIELRKVKEEPQVSTSLSTSDAKFDMIMKVMEKSMDKLYVDETLPSREHNEPHIRNPNFRRPQGPPAPKILQRGQINPNDQVRPPFQEYLVDENYPEQPEDHIH
jgi:hypothetical protein